MMLSTKRRCHACETLAALLHQHERVGQQAGTMPSATPAINLPTLTAQACQAPCRRELEIAQPQAIPQLTR